MLLLADDGSHLSVNLHEHGFLLGVCGGAEPVVLHLEHALADVGLGLPLLVARCEQLLLAATRLPVLRLRLARLPLLVLLIVVVVAGKDRGVDAVALLLRPISQVLVMLLDEGVLCLRLLPWLVLGRDNFPGGEA